MTEEEIMSTKQNADFSAALMWLKLGERLARTGWNGKNMWIQLVNPTSQDGRQLPYIQMKTADDKLVPWLASQTDVLANDWWVLPMGRAEGSVAVLMSWGQIKHLRPVREYLDVIELRDGDAICEIDPETGHAWRTGWLGGEHVRQRVPTYDELIL